MSITLTTPFTLSGSETENDASAAATSLDIDFQAGIGTIVYRQGNVVGGLLVIGANAPVYVLTVNFNTGAWSVTQGTTVVQSGTFSGAGFTSFINQFVAIRNAGESFAAAGPGNFLPGTQVAWANGVIG